MDNRKILFLAILSVILGAGLYLAYNYKRTGTVPIQNPIQTLVQKSYKVTHIGVLQGHEFDLKLEDGRRIHGVLNVKTPKEARDRMVRFINQATHPRVVLLERLNVPTHLGNAEIWRVRLYVTVGPSEVNVVDWLKDQNLVWQ